MKKLLDKEAVSIPWKSACEVQPGGRCVQRLGSLRDSICEYVLSTSTGRLVIGVFDTIT
ncbi:MAG: hypothetical protein U9R58_04115 [Chloroflexota bacterium]|nr:hypothetical protein [Chloroflexota bacterium]